MSVLRPSLIEHYQRYLPIRDLNCVVSLGEGLTPLIKLNHSFSNDLEVYVKFEGTNPTGSFKDRGMTMAISHALENKVRAVMCASTGNTSASAAAYAARAGMRCFVLIPEGKIALGKLAQAMIHGAYVIQIQGNFDEGMSLVKTLTQEMPITLVNSVNPYRLQGQKTIAFEIVDELKQAPDYHFLPVGNAGNISATWMGYQEYQQAGKITKSPVMVGCQAQGANPFIVGHPIDQPETVATAIRIGRPQSWDLALEAQKNSKGWFLDLPDAGILEAQTWLAHQGVFCEPASAASVAGLLKALEEEAIPKGSTCVCTLTGHGLKDPTLALEQCQDILDAVPADIQHIKTIIQQQLVA